MSQSRTRTIAAVSREKVELEKLLTLERQRREYRTEHDMLTRVKGVCSTPHQDKFYLKKSLISIS